MSKMQLDQELGLFCERLLPRMLTQVCRDPGHPGYGSFDRNWWHYKIRDFSSIILQQGGYALLSASNLPEFSPMKEGLRELAAGSCRFWNTRAMGHGAFEEYYPWEQGYPPVAFSALAVAKMAAEGVVEPADIQDGLKRAADQLLSRFESKATNQQVAGTAAVCWIRKIAPQLVDEVAFNTLCDRTLACQHDEGWYMEYGGPDLGYLSVTMDCLWDAYDATGDIRFRESARRALNFISPFVMMPQHGAGMFNARNTDYIVPYGIARFLNDDESRDAAATVLQRLFWDCSHPDHFLHAVDDRYCCHYIGHSLFRAVDLLRKHLSEGCVPYSAKESVYFEGTGQWLRSQTVTGCSALVAAKKGGILSLDFNGAGCSDFGWIVSKNGQDWVSHWWGDFWEIERGSDLMSISGHMTPHKENNSTPLKHMVLRGLSLVFGRKIIGVLKEKMIFKEKQSAGIPFRRQIRFLYEGVEVVDSIGLEDDGGLQRAPRSSKRHVASADSYHPEDMACCDPLVEIEEVRSIKGDCVQISTLYRSKS
jgi:hypothetical protein